MMSEKEKKDKNKAKETIETIENVEIVDTVVENIGKKTLSHEEIEKNLKKLKCERKLAAKKKKKDLINNVELAEIMCEEESIDVLNKHNANFTFDHFCGEVKTIFVKEDLSCKKLTHNMLISLKERIKLIEKRWQVGILTSTRRTFGSNGEDDDLDDDLTDIV
tara:strand:- start:3306 stop:3794 length:489 start_codon:yes stop_codon:yes gene_type:complete